jgi:hypothetical protein
MDELGGVGVNVTEVGFHGANFRIEGGSVWSFRTRAPTCAGPPINF